MPTRIFRRSCSEVFCNKGVFQNFIIFIGKHLYQSLFFDKVRAATLFKKGLRQWCFLINFVTFLQKHLFRRTPIDCFCWSDVNTLFDCSYLFYTTILFYFVLLTLFVFDINKVQPMYFEYYLEIDLKWPKNQAGFPREEGTQKRWGQIFVVSRKMPTVVI